MKVFLPFPVEALTDVPPGFEFELADPAKPWPESVSDVELYVPSYTFPARGAAVIADMPRLRVVQTLTAGVDHIRAAIPDGVTLCNAAGVHDAATSELAVGMIIAAQRRIPDHVRRQDERVWDQQMSRSLADQNVLVVGAGNIGHAIERRLAGFECAVTLVGQRARDGVHGAAELRGLLPGADIVVLILPLTDDTLGLVDEVFLAAMHDGALLVNVARGPIVVTDALLAELSSGRLRAALDVTDPEPLPAEHPLWDAPGLLLTPHIGGASSAMWPRVYQLVGEQLRRVATGKPLLNVV